jgi:hypothetical protein
MSCVPRHAQKCVSHINTLLLHSSSSFYYLTAYGTEMIRSAIDREVGFEELQTTRQAISVHTELAVKDIKVLYAETNNDRHVLHHFVAVDHATKSIVLALRGTLSLSGAIVDMQAMAVDYCTGLAHQGIAEMAENVWKESGDKIMNLCDGPEFQEYRFLITGHSLGAGAACLLNLKLHVEGQLGDRPICCYAFAPPPTFYPCGEDLDYGSKKIDQAIQNTVGYIHDNDAVPFLSISAVRRLATLLDAVDNQTEHIWFWRRWRIFYAHHSTAQRTSYFKLCCLIRTVGYLRRCVATALSRRNRLECQADSILSNTQQPAYMHHEP